MCRRIRDVENTVTPGKVAPSSPDYEALVDRHGPRRRALEARSNR
jgi:hypothetical protein